MLDEKQLQLKYYQNMEFFKANYKELFISLTQNPILYNLHIDNHGLNIIHIPSNKLQYPVQDMESTMLSSHKDLSSNVLKNNKWNLALNFSLKLDSNMIDENRLHITGKGANAMLKDSIKSLDINTNLSLDEIERASSMQAFNNLIDSFIESKYLPQTFIYGLMGGLFLQDLLDNSFYIQSLMIYEEHIDLFRISLYFIDYPLLFSRVNRHACFIMIRDIYPPLVKGFIQSKRVSNNLLSVDIKHYESKQIAFLQNLIMQEKKAIMRGWGSYEDEIIGFKNAIKNLPCKTLTQPKKINAPICVVGSGASLDLNIDFLKAYKDSVIIFSCGTALKVLKSHGIEPDFQIEIERVPYLCDVLKEAGLDSIPLIFAQTTDSNAVNMASEKYAFFRGGSASAYIYDGFVLEFSAPFVGNAGVALACALSDSVILCGLDCGYIQGYAKHAKNSFYGDESSSIPADCFEIRGNLGLRVYSNDLFYLSAKNISESIKLYKPKSVVNIGYGAMIDGAISAYEDSVALKAIDKKKALDSIKAAFVDMRIDINKDEILRIAREFVAEIESRLDSKIDSAKSLFEMIGDIESTLAKAISKQEKRKAVILFEGSILHLCSSLAISYLFKKGGNDDLKLYIKAALESMLNDLENAIFC